MVQPIPAGNALRLFVQPPAGAARWKILRKGSNVFSGHDDPSALVAYDGAERIFVDTVALMNEVMAFYCPFYTADGVTWTAGPVANGTPVGSYEEVTTDVLSFLRDRLEAGLKIEVERNNIVNDLGYVQVFNSSPSLERDLQFPLVTVHLENEEASVRGIGENIGGFIGDDDTEDSDGWLADVRVTLIGWSLNSDERIELRKALRRIIIANLAVFASKGWQQIELSLQDMDAVNGEYAAPMFQVMGNFSCQAPVLVTGGTGSSTISTITSRSIAP